MTNGRRRTARFVLTRVVVGAMAVATFVGFWAAVAIEQGDTASVDPTPVDYAVVGVQVIDGEQPLIVVERQPIEYIDRYVDSQGNPLPGPALPSQSVFGSAPVTPSTQDQPEPRAPTARRSRGS